MSIPVLDRAKLLTLAADLLELASDEFGNHGCNDWDPPADWDDCDRDAFALRAWVANGRPKDEEPTKDDPQHVQADWWAMYTCACELRRMAKEAKR